MTPEEFQQWHDAEPCSNCGRTYAVCHGGDECDRWSARGDGAE